MYAWSLRRPRVSNGVVVQIGNSMRALFLYLPTSLLRASVLTVTTLPLLSQTVGTLSLPGQPSFDVKVMHDVSKSCSFLHVLWVRCTPSYRIGIKYAPFPSPSSLFRLSNTRVVKIVASACVYCTLHEVWKGLILCVILVVSSVQISLATGHAVLLLAQLIRAFIDTAGTLNGPSSYLLG
ncbi:hypothetical protein EDB89DRAFT_1032826 [Lactarius sanguifluus]|nr:hypothetical protein EDB89DRAFT_1032826 [Lactarius sanguifluus]